MKLVAGWRRVLARAQSMWGVYLAGILELSINLLPYAGEYLPWWAPLAAIVAIPFLRIIDQGGLNADQ